MYACWHKDNLPYLLCNWTDVFEGQWLKAIPFEVVIEIDLQALKDDAYVAMVSEAFICMYKVKLFAIHLTQPSQNIHLYLALFSVGGQVFENLHSNNFIGVFLPTSQHLTKGPTS